MNAHENEPGRPAVGRKRLLIQLSVAAAIVLVFAFVIWATATGQDNDHEQSLVTGR